LDARSRQVIDRGKLLSTSSASAVVIGNACTLDGHTGQYGRPRINLAENNDA
jgi:hypothetical protein